MQLPRRVMRSSKELFRKYAHKVIPSSRADSGQVLVMFGLMTFVLVGFLALAIDGGFLLSKRRDAQNQADAAALSAAISLAHGESDGAVTGVAQSYADVNGFEAGTRDVQITRNTMSGPVTDGAVKVTLESPVDTFFLGAVYSGDWEIGAYARALINNDKDGKFALEAQKMPGISVKGKGKIIVDNGSAFSNGDVSRDGTPNIFAVDGTIDAVGEVDYGSNWSGEYRNNRPPILDPVVEAGIKGPLSTGAGWVPAYNEVTTDMLIAGGFEKTGPSWTCKNGNACTLPSGYYKNLGQIVAKGDVTLDSGLFYFEKTSLEGGNTSGTITGSDVTLYFDANSSTNSTYFDPKNSIIDLRAPASSLYTDGLDKMALWIGNCSEFDSQGNNHFYLEGMFYAPCSDVTLHGNPDGKSVSGQVIVGTLLVEGDFAFEIQYENIVFTPSLEIYLVE